MRSTSKNKRHQKQWAREPSGWRMKNTVQLSWVKCSLMDFVGDGYIHICTMTRHIRMSCSPMQDKWPHRAYRQCSVPPQKRGLSAPSSNKHLLTYRWLSLNCYGGFSHWDSLWPRTGPRPRAVWMRSDGTSWNLTVPSLAQVWGTTLISLKD